MRNQSIKRLQRTARQARRAVAKHPYMRGSAGYLGGGPLGARSTSIPHTPFSAPLGSLRAPLRSLPVSMPMRGFGMGGPLAARGTTASVPRTPGLNRPMGSFLGGGPLGGRPRRTMPSTPRISRPMGNYMTGGPLATRMGGVAGIRQAPPAGSDGRTLARNGKRTAAMVVGAGVGGFMMGRSRTGRSVDPMTGRPTGMYMY